MEQRSKLFVELYAVLHRIAGRRLQQERYVGNATSLVHDAYLKLRSQKSEFDNEQQFLAVASSAMRQILVDRARARKAQKRDPNANGVSICIEQTAEAGNNVIAVLLLDELLDGLAGFDARAALIAEMKIFLGLSTTEIADALKIVDRTVKRDWAIAKAWLRSEMSRSNGDPA